MTWFVDSSRQSRRLPLRVFIGALLSPPDGVTQRSRDPINPFVTIALGLCGVLGSVGLLGQGHHLLDDGRDALVPRLASIEAFAAIFVPSMAMVLKFASHARATSSP